jgi:hypothetical protein
VGGLVGDERTASDREGLLRHQLDPLGFRFQRAEGFPEQYDLFPREAGPRSDARSNLFPMSLDELEEFVAGDDESRRKWLKG